jgi:hypothetical protein
MSIPDIDYVLGLELGQFEYSVPLSPVKPADIEQIAKEYLENKQKEENERPTSDDSGTD